MFSPFNQRSPQNLAELRILSGDLSYHANASGLELHRLRAIVGASMKLAILLHRCPQLEFYACCVQGVLKSNGEIERIKD